MSQTYHRPNKDVGPTASSVDFVSRRDEATHPEPPRPAPLLWPATAFLGGIWLSETIGAVGGSLGWLISVVPIVATVALAFVLRARHERLAKWLVLGMALAVGFVRHQAVLYCPPHHISRVLEAEPILTRLAGEVILSPISEPPKRRNLFLPFNPTGRTRFVIAAREFRTGSIPTPTVGRLRVSVAAEQLELRLGDVVELTGELYRPRGPQNPGEIDWAHVSYLQGIDAGLSVEGPQHVRRSGADRSWTRRAVTTARSVAQSLLLEPYAHLGPEHEQEGEIRRLLDTMVLGQRAAASDQINQAFLRAGATHYLAVSGFNVSLLAGATWWVVRRLLRRSRLSAALATVVVILLFALVAEPNAPVLRAAVAGLLAALATLGRRPFCALNWLAFSALCVLAYNPLELFRAAFQLSFVQVLALFTVVPWAYRAAFRRRTQDEPSREVQTVWKFVGRYMWHAVLALALVSAVAWLVALPLMLLHFRYFAPWGALGSFLLSLPVALLTVQSFVTMLANLLVPALGSWLAVALAFAAEVLLRVVDLFRYLPAAVVEARPAPVWLVLLSYGALLALVVSERWPVPPRPYRREALRLGRVWLVPRVAAIGVGLLWVGWAVIPGRAGADDYAVVVLSVGNGSATLITTPDRRAAIVDAGTDRNADVGETVARALSDLGAERLDWLALSHGNFDHYSGVPTLLNKVPTERLLLSPHFAAGSAANPALRHFLELLEPRQPRTLTLRDGDQLLMGGLELDVLWPPLDLDAQRWSSNDRSLVLRLHAGGRTVLLPGDIERAAIRGLLEAEAAGRVRLTSDVLIAPHHGSVETTETAALLRAVNPEVIVVSAAHARPKFAALVREVLGPDCHVVLTHDCGAITVRITRAGEIAVETMSAVCGPR